MPIASPRQETPDDISDRSHLLRALREVRQARADQVLALTLTPSDPNREQALAAARAVIARLDAALQQLEH